MTALSAADTTALLPHADLVAALRVAALELAAGKIDCPQRQVLPLGEGGALLSMVAVGADLGVHKLVTVVPQNRERGLPTIQGQVSVVSAATGAIVLTLDGATVTGRRTAALSMLGVMTLGSGAPQCVRIHGTGTQSLHHLEAIAALYPAARVQVVGRTPASAEAFCARHAAAFPTLRPASAEFVNDEVDLVLTCTTSPEPVYRAHARGGRLIIAVGAYTPVSAEVDVATVRGSTLYIDDMANARHEAGDLIRAKVDWAQVRSIAEAIADAAGTDAAPRAGHGAGAILFKTVGSAAWDLAAARVAVGTGAVTNLS
jgi:1-piperideine-2-carboxylate/1-pyrroline-2-carboxylate reductase [NAD(P)H]